MLNQRAWNNCLNEVQEKIALEPQQFGRGQLYQGHEGWGILGQRPTLERLRHYRLAEWLPEQAKVLDIGCNIGLFGLELSPRIKEYYGFDNNPTLIDIARMLAEARGCKNCKFECTEFVDFFENRAGEKFDVIFSFAVHVWIGMLPNKYSEFLSGLLNPGGKLILESNRLDTNDKDFFSNSRFFTDTGLAVDLQGTLKDDGIIERGFYVFSKGPGA
ncbi:class I SAM-dependent methyltransferase [Candidimonas sp. SYP-B2681]|uniref:class I SAM-dependent methyltransferase n=1 Tax=Candidimonas sp. SYP-B2681 TaxID=2497686 RepID=UPI000F89889B|nr:class I SAM-dependent methyltransferase [Candidimonas sp. SYP-B2681]RTZ47583.1 class I SAM-dependent methyltransferase [Candidimonas sp. SYP-B2681]